MTSSRLAFRDQTRNLGAHLGGFAARALGEILPPARAAHADDSRCSSRSSGEYDRDRHAAAAFRCAARTPARRDDSISSNMPAVVAASGAGNFAIANANVRSGSSDDARAERHDGEPQPDPVHQRVDRRSPGSPTGRHLERRHDEVEIFVGLRRIATSVVGSSCFRKNHRAGYIFPISLPPSNTVTCAVTICFWPSSVTRSASSRTV